MKEKPPKGYKWSSGKRLTKNQATARLENVWPEVWTQIRKAAQKREKQEWAIEKPEIHNAPRMRGIHLIDPEDGDHKETIKHARRRLVVPRKEPRNNARLRKLKRRVMHSTVSKNKAS